MGTSPQITFSPSDIDTSGSTPVATGTGAQSFRTGTAQAAPVSNAPITFSPSDIDTTVPSVSANSNNGPSETSATTSPLGWYEGAAKGAKDVLSGIGGGLAQGVNDALKLGTGISNTINRVIPGAPTDIQAPQLPQEYTEQRNTGEKIGGGIESIMEFIAGDEALKGLSLAKKLGIASKVAELAETSPKLAKAVDIGMNASRIGAVSGGQTAFHGGSASDVAESAAIGAGSTAAIEGGASVLKSVIGDYFHNTYDVPTMINKLEASNQQARDGSVEMFEQFQDHLPEESKQAYQELLNNSISQNKLGDEEIDPLKLEANVQKLRTAIAPSSGLLDSTGKPISNSQTALESMFGDALPDFEQGLDTYKAFTLTAQNLADVSKVAPDPVTKFLTGVIRHPGGTFYAASALNNIRQGNFEDAGKDLLEGLAAEAATAGGKALLGNAGFRSGLLKTLDWLSHASEARPLNTEGLGSDIASGARKVGSKIADLAQDESGELRLPVPSDSADAGTEAQSSSASQTGLPENTRVSPIATATLDEDVPLAGVAEDAVTPTRVPARKSAPTWPIDNQMAKNIQGHNWTHEYTEARIGNPQQVVANHAKDGLVRDALTTIFEGDATPKNEALLTELLGRQSVAQIKNNPDIWEGANGVSGLKQVVQDADYNPAKQFPKDFWKSQIKYTDDAIRRAGGQTDSQTGLLRREVPKLQLPQDIQKTPRINNPDLKDTDEAIAESYERSEDTRAKSSAKSLSNTEQRYYNRPDNSPAPVNNGYESNSAPNDLEIPEPKIETGIIRQVYNSLPENSDSARLSKKIFAYTHFGGLNSTEVANALNKEGVEISDAGVRKRLARTSEQLRTARQEKLSSEDAGYNKAIQARTSIADILKAKNSPLFGK